jgi:anti-sigma B factor antagonist
MEIVTTVNDGVVCLAPKGQLSALTADEFGAELDKVLPQAEKGLKLDFKNLSYLASAGLRVLIATQKKLSGRNVPITILNVCDDVRDVFEVTGLDEVFELTN